MQNLIELGKQMRRAWRGPNPRSIESLPYSISQPKCIRANSPTAPNVPLGMDFETLLPVGLTPEADGPVFLVTGSAGQSGKTTAMLSWALGLAERRAPSDLQMIFLDFHARSFLPLRYLPHTLEYVHRPMDVEPCLKRLLAAVEQRAAAAEEAFQNDPDHDGDGAFPAAQLLYAVFIDDYDRFASRCESAPRLLARCLAAGGGAGLCMMIAGNASDLPKDYDDELMRKARRAGCGLLFSGNAAIDQFGNTKSPPYQPPAGLPPGRGYLIRKGTARIFQNYRYWEDGRTPAECLQERVAAIRAANSDSKIPAWPDTLQPKGG
jgi:hypothetical protein